MSATPAAPRRGPSGLPGFVLALALYTALALVVFWPILPHMGNTFASLPGDGTQDVYEKLWNLDWSARALLRGTNLFFTDMLYAPFGVALYFHPLSLANTLPVAPLTLLWGPGVAYNSLVILSFGLGGAALYLLARLHSATFGPALVAGLGYSFSAFHVAHVLLNHLEIVAVQWLPLYACAVVALLQRPTWRRALVCALALLAVISSSLYMAVYAGLISLALAGHAAWGSRRTGAHWRGLAWFGAALTLAGLVAGALLLVPMLQLAAANPALTRSSEEAAGRSTAPLELLLRGNRSYLGLAMLGLAALALFSKTARALWHWWLLILLALWLALGPQGGLYQLYAALPLASFGRYPDRFVVVGLVGMSLVGAVSTLR